MRKLAIFFCKGICGADPPELRSYDLRFPAFHVCEPDGSFQALFMSHRRYSIAMWRRGIQAEGATIVQQHFFGRGARRCIERTLESLVAARERLHGRVPLPEHFVRCEQYLQNNGVMPSVDEEEEDEEPVPLSQSLDRPRNSTNF